jgi:hypothetical protein
MDNGHLTGKIVKPVRKPGRLRIRRAVPVDRFGIRKI